ncbi:SMI1/KNR4 family protein [Streptomyces beihaiensis]|uniref:SMI1/KNR4 family protein n=1 Tax=Streptomyces beihaiensis TaxID=2984495 RepID=A0ABT3TPI6_9ACTN|nr:SMI1/KNR4 family protein [Streptomyces beihaiensis]MCX3058377.1 SMI1/KNR4 family protein [Streptomyces beihaiensis]
MDYSEFETLLEQVRSTHPFWFEGFEGWRASEEEIADIEANFRVVLPVSYRRFMATVGGGGFGFLDIFPLGPRQGSVEDFQSVNSERWWDADFVAFSPVGTGDLWGFMVENGACLDRVTFLDHETGEVMPENQEFLEFLVSKALKP